MRTNRAEAGFSLVELLTVTALIGVLAGLALINSREFRERAYDTASISDYRNLKTVVFAEEQESQGDASSNYMIFARTGPAELPPPLQQARLGRDVQLFFALRLTIGPTSIVAFQVAHNKGPNLYRYISINETVTEQIIAR